MVSSASPTNKWMNFLNMDGFAILPGLDDANYPSFADWPNLGVEQAECRAREECLKDSAGNKANREKQRRDRLNERFIELAVALEPGRPPKTDKATILCDAVRIIAQLRTESQQLKDGTQHLREQIKELKAEKNELRDEKARLKTEKERLEQQVKAMTLPTGYFPPPSAMQAAAAAFAAQAQAQAQAVSMKATGPVGYPGMPMWQWLPPAALDTSQDHVLRPPVA
eukprot:jgi/Mesen1/6214/ME000320S05410